MSQKLNKIWQEILIWNKAFFPAIVILFIVFALIEEFRPGFFTFYFSENWLIAFVLISCGLMLFNKEDLDLQTEKKRNIKAVLFLWLFFILLFTGVLIYRTNELLFIFKILLIPIAIFIFAIFSFAIIFPAEDEQKKLLDPFKTAHFYNLTKKTLFYLFSGIVILILSILFFLAVVDPIYLSELFSKIKNIDLKSMLIIEEIEDNNLKYFIN